MKTSIAILLCLMLTACATTQQAISPTDRANIRSVMVDKAVAVPEKMYYLGPGGAFGMAFGAIGGALSASSIEDSRSTFQKEAAEGEEAIKKIVSEETLAQMKASGKFPIVDTSSPEARTVHLSVLQYGFSIPHGFSSKLVPILYIKCEMKDSTGRVLWMGANRTLTLGNPVEGVDADIIRKDPAARISAWRAAAKALAKNIVDSY